MYKMFIENINQFVLDFLENNKSIINKKLKINSTLLKLNKQI